MPQSEQTQRLDRWIWCARFVKSRALAAKLCAAGAVTVGEAKALKPAHPIRIGDRLRLRLGRIERTLEVLALAERRGPAREARLLYAEHGVTRIEEEDEPWVSIFADVEEEMER
jgi:ribosome-associated heat shock protein Hsp15